jgi:hypothetical protein
VTSRHKLKVGIRSDEYKVHMYDPLTTTYGLQCPERGRAWLPLSAFRTLERLPGPTKPAVFTVFFACPCGDVHPGLVTHDELDVAPLGIGTRGTFRNLMTARADSLEDELSGIAAARIGAGEWPWCFFCLLEARPKPITPSAIVLIAPDDDRFDVAVRCPTCSTISVNVVSRAHVDVPFWNDSRLAVLDRVFDDPGDAGVDGLRHELAVACMGDERFELEL